MGVEDDRRLVSRLIYRVLTESLSVREAILKFPKDVNDASLKTAYHALVHLEADEDLRRRDLLYRQEQDDYLEFIAQTLQKGEILPYNIIKEYEKYYEGISTPRSESMKGILKKLCRFLNV